MHFMRHVKCFAYAVLALSIVAPLSAQAEGAAVTSMPPEGTPMVFVNTGAILPIAPGADDAQAAFQRELDGFRVELEGLSAQIDSLLADYRRKESLLDPAAKQAKQQEILDLQKAAQDRQTQLESQSEERRATLLEPIVTNVRAVIEKLRAERNYRIVFDIAESGVIAADSALDITGAVLERLGVSPSATTSGPNF